MTDATASSPASPPSLSSSSSSSSSSSQQPPRSSPSRPPSQPAQPQPELSPQLPSPPSSRATPESSPPPPSPYNLPPRLPDEFEDASWNPCLKSDIRFRNLPTEIILRILGYLSPHDLVQSASCCREWYHIASDPFLWRHLNLSALHSNSFNPKTAVALTSRLQSCRSFTLSAPKHLSQPHISALLHFLSMSRMLTKLNLVNLDHLINPHSLEHHFRFSQSGCLQHVDLNHSHVTTPAIVAMMVKHKATLLTLDLSHTNVGDGTLRAIATAQKLHTLDISSCTSISRTSIRNFLTKRFPACIETLSLRNLRDIKITWLYELMRLPTSQGLRVLNVEGCEKLGGCELGEFCEFVEGRGVKVGRTEKREEEIMGYKRYIEFLGNGPGLQERLVRGEKAMEAGEVSKSAPEKAASSCSASAASLETLSPSTKEPEASWVSRSIEASITAS